MEFVKVMVIFESLALAIISIKLLIDDYKRGKKGE